MASRKPQPGARFRLKEAVGNDTGAIAKGQEVVVREIVPRDQPGANAFDPKAFSEAAEERARIRERQRAEFPHPTSGGEVRVPTKEWSDEDWDLHNRHVEEIRSFDEQFQVDAVVVEWQEPTILMGPDGQKEVGEITRSWSLPVTQVRDLLEEV